MAIEWGKRFIVLAIGTPVALLFCVYKWATHIGVLFISALVMIEFRNTLQPLILSKCIPPPRKVVYSWFYRVGFGIFMSAAMTLAAAHSAAAHTLATYLVLISIFCLNLNMFRGIEATSKPAVVDVLRLTLDLFGFFYIAWPFSFAMPLREKGGVGIIVGVLLGTFLGDSGALVCGTALRGPKLLQAVSPGKTVAGAIGGVIVCVCTFLCLHSAFNAGFFPSDFMPPFSTWEVVAIGCVTAVMGAVGDLLESLLKRAAGVKDSGSLFPGHGGALDRFDSMLLLPVTLFHFLSFILYLRG